MCLDAKNGVQQVGTNFDISEVRHGFVVCDGMIEMCRTGWFEHNRERALRLELRGVWDGRGYTRQCWERS